jgi:hypothetical protein
LRGYIPLCVYVTYFLVVCFVIMATSEDGSTMLLLNQFWLMLQWGLYVHMKLVIIFLFITIADMWTCTKLINYNRLMNILLFYTVIIAVTKICWKFPRFVFAKRDNPNLTFIINTCHVYPIPQTMCSLTDSTNCEYKLSEETSKSHCGVWNITATT